MYLKKIELNGFKSFANSTILEFPKPKKGLFSITAIVGPNGSGKSNVADAIRWVMGEQSLKQIRGKKSEDVIFGGSEGKGKMSVASVTITLDNSDKRAPVDYEELVITRRVYRSGESEYIINGNSVRLLDLHILLAQAQFGQGSYSIVGQGMIDQLLLQSSAERKNFFDEAVGIKEFQIKRHQAVLKLNRTNENIKQADMILSEVEPRMKSLRRQVKKLEQRQDLETNLDDLQERYYATVYNSLSETIEKLESEQKHHEEEYKKVHTSLGGVQEELSSLAKEESRHDQFQALQNQYQDLVHKKNQMERDRAVLVGRLHTEYSKAGKQNIAWLEKKIEDLDLEYQKISKDVEVYESKFKKAKENLVELNHQLSELEQNKFKTQKQIVELEKGIFETNNTERIMPRSGFRAVEAILNQKNQFSGLIYGMVAELGRVDDRLKLSLEVAAGFNLTSIVVENDQVASECINFLKKHQLGLATFLPLNKIKARPVPHNIDQLLNNPGVEGLAVDLIEHDQKFKNIFSYVFGATLVVKDVKSARDVGIGRARMVTLEGDMLSTGGSMKGGYRRKTNYSIGFSSDVSSLLTNTQNTEEKLQELKESLGEVEDQFSQKQKQIMEFKSENGVLENKLELTVKKQNDLAGEKSSFEQELSLNKLDPAEYDDMMKEIEKSKEDVSGSIESIVKEINQVQKQIEQFNEKEEEKRKRIFELQDQMQVVQSELNTISDKKNHIQVELAKVYTRREDLEEDAYQELKEHIELIVRKAGKLFDQKELDSAKVQIEKIKYKLSLIGGIDEEVMQEYEETKEKYQHLIADLNDLKKASIDLEELIKELDKVMKKRHAQAFKKIKKEFARYFKILFEGGKAELLEVYGKEGEEEREDDEEEIEDEELDQKKKKRKRKILQGIDISATPPGKKIKNITALSGGERTLTSIALVCAILHTNPPPFVLLDEVEAALDEANTVRFTKILQELAEQSQFILITHNRATMHSADVLYGVTMGNDGVSKLVSIGLGG